jgi:hypothetical protein
LTQIEWVQSPDLAPWAYEWRALEAQVLHRTHLCTFDFLAAWYRHYAGEYGGTPLVGLARQDGRLVGVAPLTMRRGSVGRVPVRRVEFAPSDVPAGEFLIDDRHPEVVGAFVESLVRSVKFDVFSLDGIDPESPQLTALRAAADRHRMPMELEDHAYAIVHLNDGYKAYFDGLSGHYRRNLNQKARKIEAAGAVVDGVHRTADPAVVERSIERLIAINEASYKLEGQRLAESHRRFLADVIRRLAQQGTLGLPILSIGGRDAAEFVPQARAFLFAPTVRARATHMIRFGLQPLLGSIRSTH